MEKGKLNLMQVKFWQEEARSCEERQKIELIQKNNYPFLLNYYEGIQGLDSKYPHVSSESKMLIISEYFPNTNALISEIMYQNPDILIEAMKPSAEDKVDLMKSALGYFFRKADGLIENRLALFDMLYAGYCAVEVDQMPDFERKHEIAEENPEEKNIFGMIKDGIKNLVNPEQVEKELALITPPMEANFCTVQGSYIRRYDPLDIPLDWRAERVRDRRYNLKKVWMSKAEFDAKYPEFAKEINPEEVKFDFSKHGLDQHKRKVLLYEFQVRLKNDQYQTIIISPYINTREIDTFLRPYKTNGFNMKIGSLHKYGKLYPISIAKINKTMSDEMNNYVRHLMEVAERNIPKFVVDKNTVKQDAKEALRSNLVNDIVEVDGNTQGKITSLQPTVTSLENKELIAIFQDQKNKLWSVSEARISGNSSPQFAEELKVEEAGFQSRKIDIQEGLRVLIEEQLDTGKDIICNFWDGEVFLKVTGKDKQTWYEPHIVNNPNGEEGNIVLNPLTNELKDTEDDESLGDFEIKIDIASASRPNRQEQLARMTLFMRELVGMRQILVEQGKDINIDEIRRISKEYGWNPDKIFVDHQPAMNPNVPAGTGEIISPEEDARRQAEAEARIGQGS